MFLLHAMLVAMSSSDSNFWQMRQISRIVRCLVQLQWLAYQTQDERNSKDDLRFHLSTLVFATYYTNLQATEEEEFKSYVWLSIQRVDGMDAC